MLSVDWMLLDTDWMLTVWQNVTLLQVVESSTVSIVRPVMSVLPDSKEALAPQKAVVYPEQKVAADYVPSQRDVPAGLDLDEFLPVSFHFWDFVSDL